MNSTRTAVRIQRKRTKGWRMPEGAVYVGRPTKWGNPFRVVPYAEWQGSRTFGPIPANWCDGRVNESAAEDAVGKFRVWVLSEWRTRSTPHPLASGDLVPVRSWHNPPGYAGEYGHYAIWKAPYTSTDIRDALAGKDLACWCPLDQPCHADVLLEIANAV